jgi:uncharacterized protein (TIGR02058 family)
MPTTHVIELGMGADLQGQDPTRACIKAVKDAIGRNYLPGLRILTGGDPARMLVTVRLGVPPEAGPVDKDAIARALPHGKATVEVAPGGLLTTGGGLFEGAADRIVVAVAAVEVAVAD